MLLLISIREAKLNDHVFWERAFFEMEGYFAEAYTFWFQYYY